MRLTANQEIPLPSLSFAGQPPHGPEMTSISPLRRLLSRLGTALLVLLAGCANLQPVEPAAPDRYVDAITQASDSRWHFVRFRFNRNAQGAVDSYLDAMIADQVVAALIDDFADQLSVWRFHRRWPKMTRATSSVSCSWRRLMWLGA